MQFFPDCVCILFFIGIETYYGTTLVRKYSLSYTLHGSTPFLSGVYEFNGDGEKYNPVHFQWDFPYSWPSQLADFSESYSEEKIDLLTGRHQQIKSQKVYTGDFTGNGKANLLIFSNLSAKDESGRVTNRYFRSLYEVDDGQISLVDKIDDRHYHDHDHYIGDFNGDGIMDYALFGPGENRRAYKFMFGTNDGKFRLISPVLAGMQSFDYAYVGDFDGDSKNFHIYNLCHILKLCSAQPLWKSVSMLHFRQ